MKKFEKQSQLIDLAIYNGEMDTARKLAIKSIPNFIKQSQKLKGFKKLYTEKF